jgi:hypothetical protein
MAIKKDYLGIKFNGWTIEAEVDRTWSHPNRKFIISDGNQTKTVWLSQLSNPTSTKPFQEPKPKKERKLKKHKIELVIDEDFVGPNWLNKNLLDEVNLLFLALKEIVPSLPIKGEVIEHVVGQVVTKFYPKSIIELGTHNQGGDINVNGSISSNDNPNLKSGKISDNGELTLSSHRLTSCVNEELNVTDEGKMINLKNILTHLAKKNSPYLAFPQDVLKRELYVCWVDLDFLQFNDFNWEIKWGAQKQNLGQFQGYRGTSLDGGIKLTITQSMSYQLWINLSRNNYKIVDKLIIN